MKQIEALEDGESEFMERGSANNESIATEMMNLYSDGGSEAARSDLHGKNKLAKSHNQKIQSEFRNSTLQAINEQAEEDDYNESSEHSGAHRRTPSNVVPSIEDLIEEAKAKDRASGRASGRAPQSLMASAEGPARRPSAKSKFLTGADDNVPLRQPGRSMVEA